MKNDIDWADLSALLTLWLRPRWLLAGGLLEVGMAGWMSTVPDGTRGHEDERLESPFYLAGVYNILTDEMGGPSWMMRWFLGGCVSARPVFFLSLTFSGGAWLTTWV
ncbi:hypothetical protein VE01_10838 [Pseudogymnoascus verrucosus]|uniref:Uncharacterized protein n=1 Tax=Pseudogymnoascus verrucosus TaxID=342668 RepID=A0A2P6FH18_9PEZI|nr:uncharacterized protein VE01_10838 [Pseudogymnoascus verrucosus]PQM43942.1 hypothetical protein VE01_10838 [Pseudogymnoascus verrucosus]